MELNDFINTTLCEIRTGILESSKARGDFASKVVKVDFDIFVLADEKGIGVYQKQAYTSASNTPEKTNAIKFSVEIDTNVP